MSLFLVYINYITLSPSLDSCQGPDDFKELRDTHGTGLNVNGSVCLNFVCQCVYQCLGYVLATHLVQVRECHCWLAM
jgi:hypothetical protein